MFVLSLRFSYIRLFLSTVTFARNWFLYGAPSVLLYIQEETLAIHALPQYSTFPTLAELGKSKKFHHLIDETIWLGFLL
jgi:hypothetical protein